MVAPSFSITASERVLPKLALDFTTAILDSRVTFTRTTSASNPATYVNSSGYVVNATNNQPRFDYTPVSLICKGLLIEESRTNTLLYSEQLENAAWGKGACTIGQDTTVSPSGSQNADKILENTTTGGHYVTQPNTVTFVSGSSYSFSVFIKAAERQYALVRSSGAVGVNGISVNLSTGATSLAVGTVSNITSTSYGNGWWRVSFTITASSNASGAIDIMASTDGNYNNRSYQGIQDYGIYIWGAQLEAGAFPTSYIPTTTTALTRNADVATMTGTNFSDWYNASEGAFSIKAALRSPATAPSFSRLYAATDGTTTNTIECVSNIAGSQVFTNVTVSSVVQATLYSQAVSANNPFTFVIGYKQDSFASATNGVIGTQDSSGTIPTVNRLGIGNINGVAVMNGWIQKLFYYPQRLINAEIVAFSK